MLWFKKMQKYCFFGAMAVVALVAAYVAGVMTPIFGPRYYGGFDYAILPGELVQVVRIQEEFTKPWMGLTEAKSRHWLYVKRPYYKGDFPFIATDGELKLKAGDYAVKEAITGKFFKVCWTPKFSSQKTSQVASLNLPMPPPPKATPTDNFLSPENRERNIKELARTKTFEDGIKIIKSHFHPVPYPVPSPTQAPEVLYESTSDTRAIASK